MGPLLGAGPNHVNVAFSQATFPDVAMQDVRAALAIWGEEITRNIKDIDSFTTNIYPTPEALIGAMRSGSVDLAVLPTLDFFRVEGSLNADLGLVSKSGPGGAQHYLLVVQAALPVQQIQALKNLRFCHVKNDAVALLFLNHTLLQQGLPEMDRFFASTEAKSKGSQALSSVYFGRADACLVTEEAYQTTIAMNPQIGRKVRILLTSPELMGSVAVYRKGYPAHMRQLVLDGVNLLKNYPRGAQILSMFQATELRQATETDLAETRRMYREYRQRKGRLL
jgi:ABC-type phosphate/phosphonate transport system substrate-binding protein